MKITTRVLLRCRKTDRTPLWLKEKSLSLATAGGTQEPKDKSISHTAHRELHEETKVKRRPKKLRPRGWLRIYKFFPGQGFLLTKIIYLFVLHVDSRKVKLLQTKDFRNGQWYSIDKLPFNVMADYYRYWAVEVWEKSICRDLWLDENSKVLRWKDVEPDQESAYPPSLETQQTNALPKKK